MLLWRIMNDLVADYGAIVPSPDAPISAFVLNETFPEHYYPEEMQFNLNVDADTNDYWLYDMLTMPSYYTKNDYSSAFLLWFEIAAYECMEYLEYQLKLFGFDYSDEQKTHAIFRCMLHDYSVSQIYSIIWASVSKLVREIMSANRHVKDLEEQVKTEKDSAKIEVLQKEISENKKELSEMEESAQDQVLTWCQSFRNLMDSEKKKIGHFNRIEDLPQSDISAFFFNRVVKIGEKGFYHVPNYDDLKVD